MAAGGGEVSDILVGTKQSGPAGNRALTETPNGRWTGLFDCNPQSASAHIPPEQYGELESIGDIIDRWWSEYWPEADHDAVD